MRSLRNRPTIGQSLTGTVIFHLCSILGNRQLTLAAQMAARSVDARQVARIDHQARERLAGRIEALRQKQDMSVNFLADSAQLSRGHLSRIFAAKINVTMITLAKLAYALEVDIGELLQPGPLVKPVFARGRPPRQRRRYV